MIKTGLLLTLFLITWPPTAHSQRLELTAIQIETMFLNQNLELIAEELNVSISDAAITQAKLWNNPTVSINGLNLWSDKAQRAGETIPPLFGSFGRNMQFSVELSQLIHLAGQRAKLVGIEKVSHEMALIQFEQVVRGLKLELRKLIATLQYLQHYESILDKQSEALNELIASSEKQYGKGNLSKNELSRIHTALLEIMNEKSATQIELQAEQKRLKNLLSEQMDQTIYVLPNDVPSLSPENLILSDLVENALKYRTELNLQKLQTNYHKKSVIYERSKRIPDLTLSVGYDRHGGVWRDFVGFGVGIDLPVFNRNQGAIKAAQIAQQQSETLTRQQQNIIKNEVAEAYANYANKYFLYKKTQQNNTIAELDEMLRVYTKNLLTRNISMIEYMDFLGTYKNAKHIMFATIRDLHLQFDELEYTAAIYNK